MSQCTRCRKRKAKRRCPVLGSDLCQLCCGLQRDKKFRCPSSCPHLARHASYQEERILRRKQALPEDLGDDERLSWLTLHIEAPLEEAVHRRPAFSDRDAVLALEYARDKVAKGTSRLLLPGWSDPFQNDVGELIFKSLENCRYQRSIVLPGSFETYATEEKRKCLENVILTAKYTAGQSLEGRKYVDSLIERFAGIKELAKTRKSVATI